MILAMTKKELLAIYAELRCYLNVSLVSIGLLATCKDWEPLKKCFVKLGNFAIPVGFALESMLSKGCAVQPILRNNFICISMRTVFKESFQALHFYAEETDQWFGALEREDWFQFLRMIRNSLEHSPLTDARFDFTDNDKQHNLPLRWRGKRLDAAMDGLQIDFSFFSPGDAFNLLYDAECYIKNNMK